MAQIILLNDGHYDFMDNIQFPVTVEGTEYRDAYVGIYGYDISHAELSRIGAPNACDEGDSLFWVLGDECQVIDCDDDLTLVKHDDVTRMYRGIDPADGSDSLFAVKNGRVAPKFYNPDCKWLSPEGFGSFESWVSWPDRYDKVRLDALHTMELLWERYDSEAQA